MVNALSGRDDVNTNYPGLSGLSAEAHGDAVRAAARQLAGEGWIVHALRLEAEAPWHLAAQRMARWRVIQVLPPAAGPQLRLSCLQRLGRLVQMPTQLGSMELWRAHLRPGGRLIFGRETLSGSAWGSDSSSLLLCERLGIALPPAAISSDAGGRRRRSQVEGSSVPGSEAARS